MIRLIQRLWHFLKSVVAKIQSFLEWLASIIARICGPPWGALRGLVARVIHAIWVFVEAVLAAWARVWRRSPERREFRRPKHVQASFALATLTTAFVSYGTPIADWVGADGTIAFVGFVFLIWVLALVLLLRWSTTDSEGWWLQSLARMRARTGLVAIERLGAIVALVLVVVAPFSSDGRTGFGQSWPLRLLLLVSFVLFLADEYRARPTSLTPAIVRPADETDSSPAEDHRAVQYQWLLEVGVVTHACDLAMVIDESRYASLRSSNPQFLVEGGHPRFGSWVVDGATPEIDFIAATFQHWCVENRWSRYVEVCLVVSFAQHFRYRLDQESVGVEEYWRYPIETLLDQEGDCEDMTILAAAILRKMGHVVAGFVTDDHAALAVSAPPGIIDGGFIEREGRRFYYCETTPGGWRVGEVPDGVDPVQLRLELIEPLESELVPTP